MRAVSGCETFNLQLQLYDGSDAAVKMIVFSKQLLHFLNFDEYIIPTICVCLRSIISFAIVWCILREVIVQFVLKTISANQVYAEKMGHAEYRNIELAIKDEHNRLPIKANIPCTMIFKNRG